MDLNEQNDFLSIIDENQKIISNMNPALNQIMIKKEEIHEISVKIKDYVQKNKKIPTSLEVNKKKYSKTECLYTLICL